jgi:hypothetical protein
VIAGRNGIPAGAAQFVVQGASVADATLTRTVAAAVGKVHYVTGFDLSLGGATLASLINVTITGLAGGTLTFVVPVIAGALLGSVFSVTFPHPIPTSAANIAVVLTVPALGAGSTAANGHLYGYTF